MNKRDISKIKTTLLKYKVTLPRDEDRLKTIELAQAALYHRKNVRTPLSSLFITQAKYISKFLWVTQILAIILTVMTSDGFSTISEIQGLIFTVVPILTFYVVPEVMKAKIYGMSEVEVVCKNTLAKIMIIKLIIIGTVNIGAILAITLFLSSRFDMRFIELLVYGLIPFNIMNFMNLLVLDILKLKSPFVFLSTSLVTTLLLQLTKIYFDIAQQVWNGLFFISVILLVFELYRLVINMRERQELLIWN